MPQNIMRALCAVIRPDHSKFASYGPATINYLVWNAVLAVTVILCAGVLSASQGEKALLRSDRYD